MESKYDIRPGQVWRLPESRVRYNRKVRARLEHTVYLWIMKPSVIPKGQYESRRKMHVFFCLIPTSRTYQRLYIGWDRKVWKNYIANNFIKRGAELFADDVKFYWPTRKCFATFFRKVGLL